MTDTLAPPVPHADSSRRPAELPVRRVSRPSRALLRHAAGLTLAAVLVGVAVPAVAGVGWSGAVAAVVGVPLAWLVGLGVLWLAGLLTHTVTLTAALPRLRHRQALTLSLTGSAVANVMPLGGAAGVALNYSMVRRWGFARRDFVTYTVVTNVWDVLAKLVLAAVALPLVALTGGVALGGLGSAGRVEGLGGLVAAVGLGGALVAGTVLACVSSRRVAGAVGSVAERLVLLALRVVRSDRRPAVAPAVLQLHEQSSGLVRRRWARLSLGMAGYTALLFCLWWACLHVVGLGGVGLAVAVLAFTVERLCTLAGLTPGGAGVVELGMSGVLLATGVGPVHALAAVALYRAFTFALEIPAGGVGLATWWAARRWGAAR